MTRVQFSATAVLLALSAGASAAPYTSVEPYPIAVETAPVSTVSRTQVVAELHEAQRLGLMAIGEGDIPIATAAQAAMIADAGALASGGPLSVAQGDGASSDDTVVVWGDSRLLWARVHAEAMEAEKLGLLSVGEGDPPQATAAQEAQIAAAGRRAVEETRIANGVAFNAGR